MGMVYSTRIRDLLGEGLGSLGGEGTASNYPGEEIRLKPQRNWTLGVGRIRGNELGLRSFSHLITEAKEAKAASVPNRDFDSSPLL